MQAALKEYVIHGVSTNIDFLGSVLAHPDFQNGEVTTRWVETKLNWIPPGPSFESLIAASLADIKLSGTGHQASSLQDPDPYSPWKNPSGFRMGNP
jgi:pyruvate carboxylase